MLATLPRGFVLSFIWTLGWPASSSAKKVQQEVLQVTVKVYNSGQISSRDLIPAEEEAARIFRKVGIKIVWAAGIAASDVNDRIVSNEWNPAYLRLRIWPRSSAGSRATDTNLLGFCLSMERSDAVVLSDQIQNIAALDFVEPSALLGLAMAHELGHLLLRLEGHSAAGIMQARFPRDLRDEEKRSMLLFTREQGKSMRNEALRRTRMQIGNEQ